MPSFKEAELKFGKADVYAFTCVDNKDAWLPEWQAMTASEEELVYRGSHAGGASAKRKHYRRSYIEDRRMNRRAIVKAGTHFPCGWYPPDKSEDPWNAGNELIDFFKDEEVAGIHFHFLLQEWRLRIMIYDPWGLKNTPELAYTMARLGELEGRLITPEALLPKIVPVVYVAEDVWGIPPNEDIVFQKDFTLGQSLFIASELNNEEELRVRCRKRYIGPDIELIA